MEIRLREWQKQAVEQVRQRIREGAKNILVVAPTGSGKTILASHIIQESERKMNRSAFVVDRVNLVNQTSETFSTVGIEHGVIQADHPLYKPSRRVQICSAQTVARRRWPDADLIVVDEAHNVSKVVKQRIEPRDTIAIGLTATPFTKGLGQVYDAVVNVTTTNKLIEDGTLAKYRIFAASEPNMEGVKVVAGEWEESETAKRAMQVVGDCVSEYLKHGNGRKFICSAVDVKHVEELHRQFMAAGIVCSPYTYNTPDEECAEIVREFRKPDSYIRGLITVTKASKGFDVPDIGVVIMARPLRNSLAEHIQFFGRGLRSYPGKEECLVLDHSGNCARFWDEWNDFFEAGVVELDDGKKKPKPKKADKGDAEDRMTKCGNCSHLHKPMPFCPACGHQYPKKEAIKHAPGTLTELVASGNRAAMTTQLWPQIVGHVLAKPRDPDKARKMALALFKKMTGEWPRAEFSQTEPAPVSREVRNKITQINMAWVKGRQSAERRPSL